MKRKDGIEMVQEKFRVVSCFFLLLLLFINTVSYLEKRCHDGNAFYAERTKQHTKQQTKIIMNYSGQLEGILSHSNEVCSLQ